MSDIRDELVALLSEEPFTYDLPEEWDTIKGENWQSEGKFESNSEIVKHLPSGRFFEVSFTRWGDHWQGYETTFESVVEVEPYEKVVIAYREVKVQ